MFAMFSFPVGIEQWPFFSFPPKRPLFNRLKLFNRGYVDVEFGLLAVPSVGCAIGGLGKMPGVYFRQQNADSPQMLLEAFYSAVDHALELPESWLFVRIATFLIPWKLVIIN